MRAYSHFCHWINQSAVSIRFCAFSPEFSNQKESVSVKGIVHPKMIERTYIDQSSEAV